MTDNRRKQRYLAIMAALDARRAAVFLRSHGFPESADKARDLMRANLRTARDYKSGWLA